MGVRVLGAVGADRDEDRPPHPLLRSSKGTWTLIAPELSQGSILPVKTSGKDPSWASNDQSDLAEGGAREGRSREGHSVSHGWEEGPPRCILGALEK